MVVCVHDVVLLAEDTQSKSNELELEEKYLYDVFFHEPNDLVIPYLEVFLHSFQDPIATYIESEWNHYFFIFHLIRIRFQSCKHELLDL